MRRPGAKAAPAVRVRRVPTADPSPTTAALHVSIRKDPIAAGDALSQQAAALVDCRKCKLCLSRTQVVFGTGSPVADLMFVGEGPGFHEDKQGEPFVGQAGKLLNELLAGIGLSRPQIYIGNVVKCRPPNNRDLLPDEIAACTPHLFQQISVIRPMVICTLGRFATRVVAKTEAPISAVRGKAKETEVAGVPVIVFPVFHPAAALYTAANRGVLEQDFQKLKVLLSRGREALLGEAEAGAPDGPPDDGEAVGPSRPGAGASGSAGIVPEVSGRPHERPAEAPEIEQLKLW